MQMNNFIYETPTKVYFGKDEELKVGKLVAEYKPKKVLIHYGGKSAKESGLLDRVKKCLDEEHIAYVELGGVVANPQLSLVRKGIKLCLDEGVDFVLAAPHRLLLPVRGVMFCGEYFCVTGYRFPAARSGFCHPGGQLLRSDYRAR